MENNTRISESHYSNLERLPERAETDSFNIVAQKSAKRYRMSSDETASKLPVSNNKGRGHGGRGRGRGRSSGRRDSNTKPAEMKFLPHTTGTNKLTAMYEMVKMHIEQYVQKTYKHGQDIAESLRELQKKDLTAEMLVRQISTYIEESEERVRKIEQEGYDVLYTAEVQNYMDRKNTLETNLGRAYACLILLVVAR